MNTLKKFHAFFMKDLLAASSYKFAFVSQFAGILFFCGSFYFLSRLFSDVSPVLLESYGGEYFPFVLIGIAMSSYLQVSLRTFSSSVREAQMLGTLEAVLSTQTSIPVVILASSVYSFVITSLRVVVFLVVGVFLGMDLGNANLISAVLILMITVVVFSSVGIISASFVMILKKGDPIGWVFNNLSWMLGGVYYPITVLPDWLRKFSYFLPITHSLEGMRGAVLLGKPIGQLWINIWPLLIFITLLLPISVFFFQFAVRRAKINGSLIIY